MKIDLIGAYRVPVKLTDNHSARPRGIPVLVGDDGKAYLPTDSEMPRNLCVEMEPEEERKGVRWAMHGAGYDLDWSDWFRDLVLTLASADGVTGRGARKHGEQLLADRIHVGVRHVEHWVSGTERPDRRDRGLWSLLRAIEREVKG